MSTRTTPTVVPAEENRAAALRWIDAFNARDDEAEAAMRTPDYIAHAPDGIQPGPMDDHGWRSFLTAFLEGFPDLHLEVEDSSADERMVAQHILFTGTHTGPFRGLPATGRPVRFSGLEINRMIDGRVAEHWFQLDALTLFEQLGPASRPGTAPAAPAGGVEDRAAFRAHTSAVTPDGRDRAPLGRGPRVTEASSRRRRLGASPRLQRDVPDRRRRLDRLRAARLARAAGFPGSDIGSEGAGVRQRPHVRITGDVAEQAHHGRCSGGTVHTKDLRTWRHRGDDRAGRPSEKEGPP